MNEIKTIESAMEKGNHYPVMHQEVMDYLFSHDRKIVVDCTIGGASHAKKFLEKMGEGAILIGIDKDSDALHIASRRLEHYEGKFHLYKSDFSQLDTVFQEEQQSGADVFFFDLGVSLYQLSTPERGFSFVKDGPLDMRMDKDAFLSCYDLVNNLSEHELEKIFKKFGEERFAKRIARSIVRSRSEEPIATTTRLAQIILSCQGRWRSHARIHPATRVFQALRIAVNRELEALEEGLRHAIALLNPGGRIAVISFHSLEDRIVKHTFREYANQGKVAIVTKKPITPNSQEVEENVPSRSGKLRVAQKTP